MIIFHKNNVGNIMNYLKLLKDYIDGMPFFSYLQLNFNDAFLDCYQEMQRIYVLDEESKMDFEMVKQILTELLGFFKNISNI